jgi:demethylmenaquinone methyltransferase/2-methoxy-6-polyprenyl-1,4-benzoquinol methylase
MAHKSTYIRRMFSSIAGSYDWLNTLLSFTLDQYWRRFAASQARLSPNSVALDVATGTGKLARALSDEGNGRSRVVGIDFCKEMLDKANIGAYENIELALGTAECLPFPSDTFDCVLVGFGLRNFASVESGLCEMRRVAKGGSRIICLEFSQPSNRLIKLLHRFYLFKLMPLIGGMISRSKEAYSYFPQSIVEFASQELEQVMKEVGLLDIETYPLTWGVVKVYIGTKKDEQST